MKRYWIAVAATMLSLSAARGQGAAVLGEIVLGESGVQLGFTTVAILPQGTQLLTSESGKFLVRNLPAGQVRLRFKRIGFAPKDTVLIMAANDTARIRIAMSRLVIQLPAMVVSGKCTDQTPLEPKPAVLSELFDQVQQNAERIKLLAEQKPFVLRTVRQNAIRSRNGRLDIVRMDTLVRPPLPAEPYRPKATVQRGQGFDIGKWALAVPELSDFADTAFTNNHCFRYAGHTRFELDSVIRVDFEPVPWLDKEVDVEGSMYLRVDNYHLAGLTLKLNRIPAQFARAGMREVNFRALFTELVPAFPVLTEWELTNVFRANEPTRVEQGQVIGVTWLDSATVKPDTVRLSCHASCDPERGDGSLLANLAQPRRQSAPSARISWRW